MSNQSRSETDSPIRVHYPHPGQRFVDVGELLKSSKVREQIERMADLARNIESRNEKESEAE